ncbi:WSC-domain-containing protein [Cenococcum geophilum 1.58]|uniref:WSC-domain-containing protein n=1 Tax=Cenococcum geophilum 1.58 TaxID=794803 RepID=UPI00358F86BD|nr:WSC-domain-containing protein [Cenococcum geophilum 1.58]
MIYYTVLRVILAAIFIACSTAAATTTATSATTPSSTSMVQINPGEGKYKYAGCYNETTGYADAGGVRALGAQGWTMEAHDDMTVDMCFSFCNSQQFAGLEYGSECWCAPYLSAFSNKLPDSDCNIPCQGNSSVACGGRLTITLYNITTSAKGGAIGLTRSTGLGAVALGLAVVVMVFL